MAQMIARVYDAAAVIMNQFVRLLWSALSLLLRSAVDPVAQPWTKRRERLSRGSVRHVSPAVVKVHQSEGLHTWANSVFRNTFPHLVRAK